MWNELIREFLLLIGSKALLFFQGFDTNKWGRVFFKEDLVIVTASDKYFYESFMQLIESISIYEKNTEIIFYDIGLNESQKEHLKSQYKN